MMVKINDRHNFLFLVLLIMLTLSSCKKEVQCKCYNNQERRTFFVLLCDHNTCEELNSNTLKCKKI